MLGFLGLGGGWFSRLLFVSRSSFIGRLAAGYCGREFAECLMIVPELYCPVQCCPLILVKKKAADTYRHTTPRQIQHDAYVACGTRILRHTETGVEKRCKSLKQSPSVADMWQD
jgi:hypothetical protein